MVNICQDDIEKVKVTISQRHLIALILFIKLNESKFLYLRSYHVSFYIVIAKTKLLSYRFTFAY